MEQEELKTFFTKLADKFRKENDLSDITWALCEAFPDFEKLFLSFFFVEITDTAGITLEREYSRGISRPDFFFKHNKTEYIIEVKKGDMNDHFEQYKNDFPNSRFGWIANYKMETKRSDGIQIRTWEGFKIFLESSVAKNNIEPLAKNIIQSYCNYLKSVCSIVKFKKMKLDNLSSLFLFNKLIDKIIETPIDKLDISIYTQSKGTREDRSGKSFTIRKTGSSEKEIYPWFGIYYDQDKTCICIGFGEIWCKSVFNGVSQNLKEGNYFIEPYYEEGAYWFELKANLFDEFNAEPDFLKQEEMLNGFYREVIESVKRFL